MEQIVKPIWILLDSDNLISCKKLFAILFMGYFKQHMVWYDQALCLCDKMLSTLDYIWLNITNNQQELASD